jgi:hypothetical protein
MAPYRLTDPDGNTYSHDPGSHAEEGAVLTKLLDAHIESYRIAEGDPPRLVINFSTGWKLTLTEYGGYESFVIYAADGSPLPI